MMKTTHFLWKRKIIPLTACLSFHLMLKCSICMRRKRSKYDIPNYKQAVKNNRFSDFLNFSRGLGGNTFTYKADESV